jgi:ATP-dependent DNA helicase RecG
MNSLAAALVFGHDTTIQSAAPGYKFDALLRRRDTERYDDRLIVRTNLIDAFDLLMGFVEKHLNDPFYMEGVTSISLRSIMFRELVANIIAHREYTSAAPATMMIYRDRVEFRNPNVAHYHGRIEPGRFTPFPKNPTICKFMIQIGRYEELGSGVRKVNLYLPHYAPDAGKPVFDDGDMFTVTVPLGAHGGVPDEPTRKTEKGGPLLQTTGQVKSPIAPTVAPTVRRLLDLLGKTSECGSGDIRQAFGLKDRVHVHKKSESCWRM